MCRFSRRVQDSYCSVQNVQDKRALYKGASSLNFVHGKPQASLVQELQLITYPDVMYKVATAAILIQTRGVQSLFSLEMTIRSYSNFNLFPQLQMLE